MKDLITTQLARVLEDLKYEVSVDEIDLVRPPIDEFGDYSTSIALRIGKQTRLSPLNVAENIKAGFPEMSEIKEIRIVKPGFINFYFREDCLTEYVIDKKHLIYKTASKKPKNNKVIIEHTSVNPNKAMHIGHLRNAILGDSLQRLIKKFTNEVEIHNYIDDTGSQVVDTFIGLKYLNIPNNPRRAFDEYCWDLYVKVHKLYEEDPKYLEIKTKILRELEEGNNTASLETKDMVDKIVQCHLDQMKKFGIFYNLLVFESDVIKADLWSETFKILKQSPNFIFEETGAQKGCWVLKKNNEDKDGKILIRSDGTKVYTAKDVAYHFWKFGLLNNTFKFKLWEKQSVKKYLWQTNQSGKTSTKFGHANRVMNVIDERQKYPQEAVRNALEAADHKTQGQNLFHIAYGTVDLSKDTAEKLGVILSETKNKYSMSGREGIGIKISDLLKLMQAEITEKNKESTRKSISSSTTSKIAISAIRYYMLKYNYESSIVFDYKQALRLDGDSGPYLQYSYVRANNIIKKAGHHKIYFHKHEPLTKSELKLIRQIYSWKDIVIKTNQDLSISRIAEYTTQLSAVFHHFYEDSPVLSIEEKTRNFRLSLIKSYLDTLKEVFDILGIETLKEM